MNREKAIAFLRRHIRRAVEAGCCEQCQMPWHDGLCVCGGDPDPDWELDCAAAAYIAYGLDLAKEDLES